MIAVSPSRQDYQDQLACMSSTDLEKLYLWACSHLENTGALFSRENKEDIEIEKHTRKAFCYFINNISPKVSAEILRTAENYSDYGYFRIQGFDMEINPKTVLQVYREAQRFHRYTTNISNNGFPLKKRRRRFIRQETNRFKGLRVRLTREVSIEAFVCEDYD